MAAGGGGSWKVAYADFVTAMMAFFLVMWIAAQKPEAKGELAQFFRNRMLASATLNLHGGVAVLAIRDKDSESDPNKSSQFQNPSSVPLDFSRKNNEDLAKSLMENPTWKENKSMKVERTKEGLLISFFDSPGKPLFTPGSPALTEYGQMAFEAVAWELARYPASELELNGHTAGETGSRDSDAWDISSGRANTARRIMLGQGLKSSQIRKVSGLGGRSPIAGRNETDPTNRRVTILVRTGADSNPR
jgi:chemotaxis protein MotB